MQIGHNKPPSAIDQLISTVGKLPGLGPRSARRIVLHLLRRKEKVLEPLIQQLTELSESIQRCDTCGNMDVINPCHICEDQTRDTSVICVVEELADLWAMERAGMFRGTYHVLGGVLSAMDGVGPEQLGIPKLIERSAAPHVNEIILATNATADGQMTAHYIMDQLDSSRLRITRLAQGIPIGGELDYLDDGTLGAALTARLAV